MVKPEEKNRTNSWLLNAKRNYYEKNVAIGH